MRRWREAPRADPRKAVVMLGLAKLFGPSGERVAKKMRPMVERINSLEPDFQALSDSELRAVTVELRERFGEGETLDDLLPEAFAAVREASRRTTGLRHFDVQLIGGAVLHQGKVAEMKTGEGKTLVATLPVYLNALADKGVHVVTVNDYLARRDVQWMGPIYHALGLTVSSLQHEGALQYDPDARSPDPSDAGAALGGAEGGVRGGRDVRDEPRLRVRLPAGQHGGGGGLRGAAGVALRHRGRGGLHPHRRGADAADHQRAGAGVDADVHVGGAGSSRGWRRRRTTRWRRSTGR